VTFLIIIAIAPIIIIPAPAISTGPAISTALTLLVIELWTSVRPYTSRRSRFEGKRPKEGVHVGSAKQRLTCSLL
jgi:hypothetical protein